MVLQQAKGMKVVLHICCGVCTAGAAAALLNEGYEIIGFFFNPNIYPESEFHKRLDAAYSIARFFGFDLEVIPYYPEEWFQKAGSLKDEPEGGKRCEICYCLRLKKTYYYMLNCGADFFTTTLTVSPHKKASVINKIGTDIGAERFLVRDFKKREGFKQALQIARQQMIYRQNYCGCIYSVRHTKS